MAQTPNANLNANSLLSYKLLADSWDADTGDNVFRKLMKDEMKFLASGVSLLQSDPVLAMHYGGVNLNSAEKIGNVLKSKVNELEVKNRIEPSANALLAHKYATENMLSLMPGARNAVGFDEDDMNLTIKVADAAGIANAKDDIQNPWNWLEGKQGKKSGRGIMNSVTVNKNRKGRGQALSHNNESEDLG